MDILKPYRNLYRCIQEQEIVYKEYNDLLAQKKKIPSKFSSDKTEIEHEKNEYLKKIDFYSKVLEQGHGPSTNEPKIGWEITDTIKSYLFCLLLFLLNLAIFWLPNSFLFMMLKIIVFLIQLVIFFVLCCLVPKLFFIPIILYKLNEVISDKIYWSNYFRWRMHYEVDRGYITASLIGTLIVWLPCFIIGHKIYKKYKPEIIKKHEIKLKEYKKTCEEDCSEARHFFNSKDEMMARFDNRLTVVLEKEKSEFQIIDSKIADSVYRFRQLEDEANYNRSPIPITKLHRYPEGLKYVIENVSDTIYDTPQEAMRGLQDLENAQYIANSFHQTNQKMINVMCKAFQSLELQNQRRHQETLESQQKMHKENMSQQRKLHEDSKKHQKSLQEELVKNQKNLQAGMAVVAGTNLLVANSSEKTARRVDDIANHLKVPK